MSAFATSDELKLCPACGTGKLWEYAINTDQGAIACKSCRWWTLTNLTDEQKTELRATLAGSRKAGVT